MKAVYPGSFDPTTNGHIDIIERGARLVDELIVAVAVNISKEPLFDTDARVEMLSESLSHMPDVKVVHFEGMVVDFVKDQEANAILRGIRTVSDFEYEMQMAWTNHALSPTIETLFVMASQQYSFLSSRLIKEVAMLDGDISKFVPAPVESRLRKLFT